MVTIHVKEEIFLLKDRRNTATAACVNTKIR